MVMTVLSGIEVLGVLTSTTTFNQKNGAAHFGEFWKHYLYRDRLAFKRLDSLVYEFVRHGLAHSSMTKPMILITKDRRPEHLYRIDEDTLCVDALTLADDFEAAYGQRLRPKIAGDFKANMQVRFNEMRAAYREEHETKKNHFARAPLHPRGSNLEFNLTTHVNSPAVPGDYSTNVSHFDKPQD